MEILLIRDLKSDTSIKKTQPKTMPTILLSLELIISIKVDSHGRKREASLFGETLIIRFPQYQSI